MKIIGNKSVDNLYYWNGKVLIEHIRDTIINNAYKFVKNYDIEMISNKMVELYNKILSK